MMTGRDTWVCEVSMRGTVYAKRGLIKFGLNQSYGVRGKKDGSREEGEYVMGERD